MKNDGKILSEIQMLQLVKLVKNGDDVSNEDTWKQDRGNNDVTRDFAAKILWLAAV